MTYRYWCLERPPAPGAVPKRGLIGCEFGEGYIWSEQKRIWGTAIYDRPLTRKEIEDYELREEDVRRD